jgi:hypothetical protein
MIILLSSLIILFLIFNFTKEDIYIKPNLPINDQSSQNFTSSKTLESIDNTILEQSNFGLPMNLKIPKINVDADIKHLGITIN